MIKLVLLAALLALADPVLACLIYCRYGGWALLALLLLPPVCGGALISAIVARLERQAAENDQPGVGFGERTMLLAARLFFWYPGPLTTLLGLLLLSGWVRRGIHRWIFGRIGEAVRKGTVSVDAGPGGVVFRSGTGVGPGAGDSWPTGPLKRAEGRVIEPAGDLPEPKSDH